MNKKIVAMVVSGVVVFGGMSYIMSSVETVQAGYEGVVYKPSGGISANTLKQGWHFISPFDKVAQYPISREIVAYSSKTDEGKAGDTSIRVGSKEGKALQADVSLTVHCDVAKLPELFTAFRGAKFETLAEGIVKQVTKAELNKVTTQYAMFDIYTTKRQEIATMTSERVGKSLEKYGIVVDNLEITDVVLDKETLDAVDKLQKAVMQQKQVMAEAQSAQSKAEAEVKVAQAEALKATAEAQIVVAKAKGQADAVIAKAMGEAKANQLLSASLTPQLVELKKLEINAETIKQSLSKWDGSVPTTIMSGNGNTQLPYLPIQLPPTK